MKKVLLVLTMLFMVGTFQAQDTTNVVTGTGGVAATFASGTENTVVKLVVVKLEINLLMSEYALGGF